MAEWKLPSTNWGKHGNTFSFKTSAQAHALRNHWANIAFPMQWRMTDPDFPTFSVVQQVLIRIIN